MDPELLDRLRNDLRAADYRAGAVEALLGAAADGARQRGAFAPAQRALAERGASPLAALIRLFLLGDAVAAEELDAALPSLGAAGLRALGLCEPQPPAADDGRLRASLSLNPVAVEDPCAERPLEWWIVSDLDDQLRRGPARPDHVMGVGGATRTLISQLPPGDAGRCLDLGTGCGIVALHLALRGPVVATDISERALEFARANARLGGVDGVEFRRGDLFAPVSGERFALIASNPPFVVTPRGGGDGGGDEPRYAYRDGGLVGDELAASVVRLAPAHLAEGGELLCLANWESHWGVDGLDRVRDWIAAASGTAPDGTALAAWVIERDRVDTVRYAETWARDGGARPGEPGFEALIRRWLDDFAARRVVALGLGAIRLRRLPASAAPGGPILRLERAEGAFGPVPGAALAEAFDAGVATAAMSDEDVLRRCWLLRDGVTELREHRPGEEAPRAIALESSAGIARRVGADPLLAAAVGACDGELSLGRIADALATLLDVDPGAAARALVAGVRELVWLGMLEPADR